MDHNSQKSLLSSLYRHRAIFFWCFLAKQRLSLGSGHVTFCNLLCYHGDICAARHLTTRPLLSRRTFVVGKSWDL